MNNKIIFVAILIEEYSKTIENIFIIITCLIGGSLMLLNDYMVEGTIIISLGLLFIKSPATVEEKSRDLHEPKNKALST
jgi:hypothetical protein